MTDTNATAVIKPDLSGVIAALARAAEHAGAALAAFGRAWARHEERHEERRAAERHQPVPLSIDGHAYAARRAARRGKGRR